MNNQTNKTISMIIISSIFLLVAIAAVSYLAYTNSIDLKSVSEIKRTNMEEEAAIISSFELKSKSENAQKISEKMDDFYINKNNLLAFIEEIESIARKNGAISSIDKVDLDKSAEADPVIPHSVLQATVNLSGSWQSVTKSLVAIENMPYMIDIKNARITSTGEGEAKRWNLNIYFEAITN